MNALARMLNGAGRRGNTLSSPDQWLQHSLGVDTTSAAGQPVSVNTALGLAPFWRGVQILSGSVGMLPCKVYRRAKDGTREEAPSGSRPWTLLHDTPNPNMAADEFWAMVEAHLDTWGNAFIWKERAGDGRVANLWPLKPQRVSVGMLPDGTLTYVIDGRPEWSFTNVEILHIRALSSDGILGYSPVMMHRQTLGSSMALQEFQGKFWANDATPGVTLVHPGQLSPEAIERVRKLWDHHHKGSRNARRTAVLSEAIEVKPMTMPLADSQFIESKRYGATEIANILGIPPYMVGGSVQDSLTYSTVEGQSVDFLKFSLAPRLVRIQSAVSWDPDLMPSNWYAEFETDAVLRSTTGERYRAYTIALDPTKGWMTREEVRRRENLPPEDHPPIPVPAPAPATDPSATTGGP